MAINGICIKCNKYKKLIKMWMIYNGSYNIMFLHIKFY